MSDLSSQDQEADAPATLHRVMQAAIAEGLRARYAPPRELPHELFVLLMQVNNQGRNGRAPRSGGPALLSRAKASRKKTATVATDGA